MVVVASEAVLVHSENDTAVIKKVAFFFSLHWNINHRNS